jgi:hypothetical protein
VDRHAAGDSAPQVRGQPLIGEVHVGEIRVAAGGRHLDRVENAGPRRALHIGHVGVPDELARAEIAGNAVDRHVRHDVDLGIIGQIAAAIGVRPGWIEFAELAAEGQQRGIVKPLVAQHQHEMRVPELVEPAEHGRGERRGGVQAEDLGAERRPDRLRLDR